jgi:3-oxoacyl-[acyl-carrier protein] reductase
MGNLTGKVAIVTGASKGIGAGIAKALGAAGAAVVVNYASSKAGADRVVDEIIGNGGKAVALQGDVAKAADVKRLFAATKEVFGALDVLVNNAGVFKFEPVENITEDEFHRQYNTNVLGPLLAAQEALKYFSANGGNIINISSVVSASPMAGAVLYSSTKGALDNLTAGLALELAPRNIRVNAINPGYTVTEGASDTGIFEGESGAELIAKTPLGRIGQPADIAAAVVFLASAESAWITGETIRVAGGVK